MTAITLQVLGPAPPRVLFVKGITAHTCLSAIEGLTPAPCPHSPLPLWLVDDDLLHRRLQAGPRLARTPPHAHLRMPSAQVAAAASPSKPSSTQCPHPQTRPPDLILSARRPPLHSNYQRLVAAKALTPPPLPSTPPPLFLQAGIGPIAMDVSKKSALKHTNPTSTQAEGTVTGCGDLDCLAACAAG